MNRYRAFLSKGFTIVELLVIIAIIGILTTIVIVAYNGIQESARRNVKISDMKSVQKLVELYNAQNGVYPATTTNL